MLDIESPVFSRRGLFRYCVAAGLGLLLAPSAATTLWSAGRGGRAWRGLEPGQVESRVPALMEEHRVPGVSVALVEGGRTVWAKGFGVRDLETGAPVTTDSIFQAASISKAVFAIGVMRLVQDGRLDLDKPLQDYLDGPWLEGEPQIEKVTARMVLEHTTGWPNWRRGKPLEFRSEPGERFSYSGEGFVFLQTAVAAIVEQPLDSWLRAHLLVPLGMDASSYTWRAEMEDTAAAGHEDGESTGPRRFRRPNTAYSLLTTPSDLAKALCFAINKPEGNPDLPAPGYVEMMLTPEGPDTRRPGLRRSLGWAVQESPQAFGHTGSNRGGHRAVAMASTQSGAGIVVMTNAVGGRDLYRDLIQDATGPQPLFGGTDES